MVVRLCDEQMQDLKLRVGVVGRVRQHLLVHLVRPPSFAEIAEHLHMTPRTLRRKLSEEKNSFRKLADELRAHVAINYLRDTDLSVDEIAYALGFSDTANFRRAFRRWTKATPVEFRDVSRAPGAIRPLP